MATFTGTSGDDTLTGTSGNDTFNLSQGGNDTAQGLAGRDLFVMGGTFNAGDSIDGGAGNDVLRLDGDYSAGVVFNATTMVSIEEIQLDAGHSYKLTTADDNIAAGTTLIVAAGALGPSDTLNFNGADESDGAFNITAGAGADIVRGGAGNDIIDFSAGGVDQGFGGGGNDTFNMGAQLTAADKIDGGAGADTVVLNGDYSAGLTFAPTTLSRVEGLTLLAGHDYDLTLSSTASTTGVFTVDASALGAGDTLSLDGRASTNGGLTIIGGAGDDVLMGSVGTFATSNTFDLSKGGNDFATGGSGGDTFNMGGALTAFDQIDGGDGNDVVVLNGDYTGANAVVFRTATFTDVENLIFSAGHDYNITIARATTLDGPMAVDARAVGSGNTVTFDGSASHQSLSFAGGPGTDVFSGSNQSDLFDTLGGGAFTFHGNGGDDVVTTNGLVASDVLDLGAGTDTVNLGPNIAVVLGATTITGVERMGISAGDNITTNDATVAAGVTLTVNVGAAAGANVVFDGSAETDGHFLFEDTGAAVLTFIGGALSDTFDIQHHEDVVATGGGGADLFGASAPVHGIFDTFVYNAVSDSTSSSYDTIRSLSFAGDILHVSPVTTVTGIDTAVNGGTLSKATFDGDLASDVGAGQLAAGHAVLFTANAGTLSGHTFLVIDANGTAGYQAGADLVIDVTGAAGTLTTGDFT